MRKHDSCILATDQMVHMTIKGRDQFSKRRQFHTIIQIAGNMQMIASLQASHHPISVSPAGTQHGDHCPLSGKYPGNQFTGIVGIAQNDNDRFLTFK